MEGIDEGQWMTLVRNTEEGRQIAFVNIDGRKVIEQGNLTHCVIFDIQYSDVTENGLPGPQSREELDRLDAREDEVAERFGMHSLGRVTAGNRIALFYYKGSECAPQPFIEAMTESCSLEIEAHIIEDPTGEQFAHHLEPTPLELLAERDKILCKTLKENGDDWSKPREIDHFFFFPDDAAVGKFVAALPTQYQHKETSLDPDGGPERMVHITSFSRTDPEAVAPISVALFELAEGAGGVYDGWACHVEKSKKGFLGKFRK